MKKFISQLFSFFLLCSIPILILALSYLYLDPFKVLYSYKSYSLQNVVIDRDFISTEMLIKNKFRYKYNSFVFGSSRTLAFKPLSWKKYLSPRDMPYMFDASNETIYGMYSKLKFLESTHTKIDNALLIMCRDKTFENPEKFKGHLYIKHPLTSGESNVNFHFTFFKAYINPAFLFNYWVYNYTRKYQSFMDGYIENRKIYYDTITNEMKDIEQEKEVLQKPTLYYENRKQWFYERRGEQIDTAHKIDSKHLCMLKEIRRILEKNGTNYRVIISPLYEQIKFSPHDLNILETVFGNHLYNFSGKNKFSDSKINFYEPSHYRPIVGDSILNVIYNTPARNINI